jgi:hypothetical protein
VPLPLLAALSTDVVADFGSRVGAAAYLYFIRWVGTWTLIGTIAGLRGLWLAFHDRGSRWLAAAAVGSNLFFLTQIVINL